jgi:hypothetical protein
MSQTPLEPFGDGASRAAGRFGKGNAGGPGTSSPSAPENKQAGFHIMESGLLFIASISPIRWMLALAYAPLISASIVRTTPPAIALKNQEFPEIFQPS